MYEYSGLERIHIPDLSGDNIELFKMILAHEAAHCYQLDQIISLDAYTNSMNWYVESTAHYFATRLYPAANGEHSTVAKYDLDGEEFHQPYSIYNF